MTEPTYAQVVTAIQNAVSSVLIFHADGTAVADAADINTAIEAGAAIAFSGLIASNTND